jgi:hypothetical protein
MRGIIGHDVRGHNDVASVLDPICVEFLHIHHSPAQRAIWRPLSMFCTIISA